tara:strand:+ start:602 stop:799 length:198 start_codon:yes stop_codon:yes gene_type:complete
MKIHPTVIEKLVTIYTNYGGFKEETRLRDALGRLDLTEYTQQTGEGKTFLVLTEDISNHMKNLKS